MPDTHLKSEEPNEWNGSTHYHSDYSIGRMYDDNELSSEINLRDRRRFGIVYREYLSGNVKDKDEKNE